MSGKPSGSGEGKMESTTGAEPTFSSESRAVEAVAVQHVSALALLGARGILRIEHRGELYTLRITRNDRLILTK